MQDLHLPTASNVSVYLNGYLVDMAYRIDYRESSNKVPIYGYNDVVYDIVAQSKSIIQGMLIVNFISSEYLLPAIANFDPGNDINISRNLLDSEKIHTQLKYELPPNSSIEEKKARAEYIASLVQNRQTRDRVKDALEDIYSSTRPGKVIEKTVREFPGTTNMKTVPVRSTSSLLMEIQRPNGSLIEVYFNDPARASYLLRFSNVYFNDISQQISQAGAEGSSEPLYEIYSWISSRRETIHLG